MGRGWLAALKRSATERSSLAFIIIDIDLIVLNYCARSALVRIGMKATQPEIGAVMAKVFDARVAA